MIPYPTGDFVMNNAELKAVFDRQAAGYDQQWLRMAPIYQGLYFLLESVFAELPADAQILCVGVGTGNELLHLAQRFPGWRFTAVEPSGGMLAVCRHRAAVAGISARCTFHEGYLDALPTGPHHDGATCFLVSQFLVDPAVRTAFFQQIADWLKPHGLLASADLAAEIETDSYDTLLRLWQRVMSPTDLSPEGLARMRAAYARDVAVLPPAVIAAIIEAGGFTAPVPFFQAGLIHAWVAQSR